MYRVEDVQGEEFRALIVSTVRTCTKKPPLQQGTGFLTDPKACTSIVVITIVVIACKLPE